MLPESSPADRYSLLLAQFEAMLDECDLFTQNAAYGETLNDMEEFFLFKGRKFLQETLQEKLQERIERYNLSVTIQIATILLVLGWLSGLQKCVVPV